MGNLAPSADERVRDVQVSADCSTPLPPSAPAGSRPAPATASTGPISKGPQHRRPTARCACGKEAAGCRVKAARVAALTKVPCYLAAVGPQDQR